MSTVVRIILTLLLILGVYTETGLFTAGFATLMALAIELILFQLRWLRIYTISHVKEHKAQDKTETK